MKKTYDIWQDPNIKTALKDGRSADDIAVLSCPKCGRKGYYNQGSHFYCRFCRIGYFAVSSECDKLPTAGGPYVYVEDVITLADTTTETTDGYDNRTI